MPILDGLDFGKIVQGPGGVGDMLLGAGMGLLSNRGVGQGLAQGFQNYQQLAQIGQQRKRQASLDKLAADREARMAAWQDWQRQHMGEREKVEDAQRAAGMGLQREQFDFTRAQADKPQLIKVPQPDGTEQYQFVTPSGKIGASVGAPVRQRTPEGDAVLREQALIQSRSQQGQAQGLQGDELKRFALTGQMTPANEKPTNDQANAALFARRMDASGDIISDPEIWKAGVGGRGMGGKIAESIPLVGNYLQSPDYQKLRQAETDFMNAILRRESGAAITPSEYETGNKQYFPQPGDSPEVIAQKQANRETALTGIIGAAPQSFQKSFTAERAARAAAREAKKKAKDIPAASVTTFPAWSTEK